MHLEWQDFLEERISDGLQNLEKNAANVAGHVKCFFAHQFDRDKRVLAMLRNLLENEPYYWEVVSPEEATKDEVLFENVVSQIQSSQIVIAEISSHNPNVLLETGIAFGMNKKVLLLAEEKATIPSDLKGHLLFYYNTLFIVH